MMPYDELGITVPLRLGPLAAPGGAMRLLLNSIPRRPVRYSGGQARGIDRAIAAFRREAARRDG
jgi:hypothetical protein